MNEANHAPGSLPKQTLGVAATIVPVIALVVAIASLFLQWATSPFFEASASDLKYWYTEKNVLEADNGKRQSKLFITLINESRKPARDVRIFVKPITPSPTVVCDSKHDVQDSIEQSKMITLHRIPSGSTVTIEVSEYADSYPLVVAEGRRIDFTEAIFGGKYRYTAKVLKAQTDSGQISVDIMRCQFEIDPLPDDDQFNRRGFYSGRPSLLTGQ